MVQGEGDLEQARDAGGAFQVADVGFHRADGEGLFGVACGAQDGSEGGGFDGVAASGAGAVEFDVLDVGGVDAGLRVGVAEHLFLAVGGGDGEALAAAVVVHGAAEDDGVDGVAVGDGAVQGLEDDEAGAFAAHVAVGPGVEGVAAAVRGEGAELGGADGAFGDQVEVDAAGDGDVAGAAAQVFAGEVDGDEGRGLAGVDRHAGAAQPEGVGDAVGDDAAVEAGDGVGVDVLGAVAVEQGGVVVPDGAEEDAGAGGAEGGRDDAGVFHALPAQFEHEALLGVHGGGFAGGDPEERGVEPVDVVEEAAPAGVHLAAGGGVFVEVGVGVPPVRGDGGDGAGAVLQEFPERVGAGRGGEPGCQADDGDAALVRFVLRSGNRGRRGEARICHQKLHRFSECPDAARGGRTPWEADRHQRRPVRRLLMTRGRY